MGCLMDLTNEGCNSSRDWGNDKNSIAYPVDERSTSSHKKKRRNTNKDKEVLK